VEYNYSIVHFSAGKKYKYKGVSLEPAFSLSLYIAERGGLYRVKLTLNRNTDDILVTLDGGVSVTVSPLTVSVVMLFFYVYIYDRLTSI